MRSGNAAIRFYGERWVGCRTFRQTSELWMGDCGSRMEARALRVDEWVLIIVTGRGGGTALRELADTVSDVKNVKHAFEAGVKARRGVDY